MKKYLLFLFLIVVLGFSFTACDGGGESSSNGGELAGEQNCTDGIDNDGDTETDCEDIDCIFDPACMIEEPPPPPVSNPNHRFIISIRCPGFYCLCGFDWSRYGKHGLRIRQYRVAYSNVKRCRF